MNKSCLVSFLVSFKIEVANNPKWVKSIMLVIMKGINLRLTTQSTKPTPLPFPLNLPFALHPTPWFLVPLPTNASLAL